MTESLELNIVQKQKALPVGKQNWEGRTKMWCGTNGERRRPDTH